MLISAVREAIEVLHGKALEPRPPPTTPAKASDPCEMEKLQGVINALKDELGAVSDFHCLFPFSRSSTQNVPKIKLQIHELCSTNTPPRSARTNTKIETLVWN
jgi:hypothetical protein